MTKIGFLSFGHWTPCLAHTLQDSRLATGCDSNHSRALGNVWSSGDRWRQPAKTHEASLAQSVVIVWHDNSGAS